MIEKRIKPMFWAPTRRRHYATLKQACLAEAGAIVRREWFDGGGVGNWTDHPEEIINRSKIASKLDSEYRASVGSKP